MEIAYLAGLFDGEGCISIQQSKNVKGIFNYCLKLIVHMNCKEIIDILQETFGGSVYIRKDKSYAWECTGTEADETLKLIVPYLIEKKKQAELGIDYSEIFGYGHRIKRTKTDRELQALYHLKMQMLKRKE